MTRSCAGMHSWATGTERMHRSWMAGWCIEVGIDRIGQEDRIGYDRMQGHGGMMQHVDRD